ncbi:MAG: thiamine phosphate synthase [Verrucomicrobiota bacterium]
MKLIVISPETEDPREPALLAELLAAGLTDYHLRKPTWTRTQLAAFLRALPPSVVERIILHTHHDLAADHPVAGLHHRTQVGACLQAMSDAPPQTSRPPQTSPASRRLPSILRSRAIHDLPTLRASLDQPDMRLLFSPVFPSTSKPGHAPRHSTDELRAILRLPRRAEVIALGGIDAERIPECRALGFDGVAVLGAIWQAPDPIAAFTHLRDIASFA